jgi:hypothetical protein
MDATWDKTQDWRVELIGPRFSYDFTWELQDFVYHQTVATSTLKINLSYPGQLYG